MEHPVYCQIESSLFDYSVDLFDLMRRQFAEQALQLIHRKPQVQLVEYLYELLANARFVSVRQLVALIVIAALPRDAYALYPLE